MDLTTITVADFRTQFPIDFHTIPDAVIVGAFLEAQVILNQALFSSDPQIKMAYLYLTAHYLCLDVRASAAGVNGMGDFPVSSRTVGSVSESYDIPKYYQESPILAQYTQTKYGMKYLSFVLPQLVGNMAAVCGGTNP